MKRIPIILLAAAMALAAAAAFSGEEAAPPGKAEMTLQGGFMGAVPFPHARHQQRLDCQACHAIFPQEAGAVESLKEKGTLKKKQVMDQCRDCHKKKIGAGEPAGPTTCRTCHPGP
ncbi:MAG: cytochrome c family protein [Proteobacteria bacterium]|nr:cytochrome c family protein [Pseudomonadota bacterium]